MAKIRKTYDIYDKASKQSKHHINESHPKPHYSKQLDKIINIVHNSSQSVYIRCERFRTFCFEQFLVQSRPHI